MSTDPDSNDLRRNFTERWRTSLDHALIEDARALLDMAQAQIAEGKNHAAGSLARAALLMAVTAADACVTDSLQIAIEWAGDSFTDVPDQLRFGPSYETWQFLRQRLRGDMSFKDKIHLGFEVVFGEPPCQPETIQQIQEARRLRNRLVHLHSLRDHPDHDLLFAPSRVLTAAERAVDAAGTLVEEMEEFFTERWQLPRAILDGFEEEDEGDSD